MRAIFSARKTPKALNLPAPLSENPTLPDAPAYNLRSRNKPPRRRYRMKLVTIRGSGSGRCSDANNPAFNTRAMLRPSTRMTCKPSSSCRASPDTRPCTLFQYCDETTGIFVMVKYLFSRSNAALAPPRRHTTTAAAGLYASLSTHETNNRSSKAHNEPFGPAK